MYRGNGVSSPTEIRKGYLWCSFCKFLAPAPNKEVSFLKSFWKVNRLASFIAKANVSSGKSSSLIGAPLSFRAVKNSPRLLPCSLSLRSKEPYSAASLNTESVAIFNVLKNLPILGKVLDALAKSIDLVVS